MHITMRSLFAVLFACTISVLQAQTTKTYTYKTVGTLGIEALVISPTLPAGQLSPVYFAIHGGALISGSKEAVLTTQARDEVLSRGWTIVSIDYRLIPAAFLQDIVEDVQDAYNWVRNELSKIEPINPDMITVFGQSAGGGLALIAGFKLSPRPKAIIAMYPYYANYNDVVCNDLITPLSEDLLSAIAEESQTISNYTGSDSARHYLAQAMLYQKKQGWVMVSRDSTESAESLSEKLRSFSAVDNIDEDYPPTYLGHGFNDEIVLFTQSIQMAKKLKEKNIEYVLDLVSGAPHSYDWTDTSKSTWENHLLPMFDFAAKFMK